VVFALILSFANRFSASAVCVLVKTERRDLTRLATDVNETVTSQAFSRDVVEFLAERPS
jgi:hypothetical protein